MGRPSRRKRRPSRCTTRSPSESFQPLFQFGATGCSEHVWSVLTTSESTRRFLFGVGLESTWETGSRITGRLDRSLVMHGEVLFAEYPNRLSYLLAAGPE
jgi:hypothetical protein